METPQSALRQKTQVQDDQETLCGPPESQDDSLLAAGDAGDSLHLLGFT